MASKMQLIILKVFELVLPVHGSEQIVFPSHTTVDQKLPDNWEDKILSLLNFVKSLIEEKSTQRDKS